MGTETKQTDASTYEEQRRLEEEQAWGEAVPAEPTPRLRWTRIPGGNHKCLDGPLECVRKCGWWDVELVAYPPKGRQSYPVLSGGPVKSLGEAKRLACDLVLEGSIRLAETSESEERLCRNPDCRKQFISHHVKKVYCSTRCWRDARDFGVERDELALRPAAQLEAALSEIEPGDESRSARLLQSAYAHRLKLDRVLQGQAEQNDWMFG